MTLETAIDRQVPHDPVAERRVLGALLIDRDAIFKIADALGHADFHEARNQRVYATIEALLERRERIDPLTVQVELARREELDRVGGVPYLRELVEAVPTAVEIERHAAVVRDRAVLRRLLGAATAIAGDAYGEPVDIALVLDRAEQRIFALRDESANVQLRHIKAALMENYEHLEARMEHPFELSGVPSGFREIDSFTEGFTPGDLVVIAARPSVGKTSLGLAIAYNVARRGTGALVFSLEMDTKQIVARFLGMNSQTDLLALRTGNLLDTEAADALMGLPISIDDTPGLSIMELRTKARRVSVQGKLGVVVVDYLQLMRTGEREENRVQEIATITRNLKSLARELDVTVIALSQLSRAAGETSEPKLSTLRECVTADTLVLLADGGRLPIGDLVGTRPEVLAMTPEGRITRATTELVWKVGRKQIFEVLLASGRTIRATAKHRLFGLDGWRTVADLHAGERLAVAREIPEPAAPLEWPERRLALLGQLIGDGSFLSGQPMRYTTASEENSRAVAEAAIEEFGARVKRYAGRGKWHQLLISGNGNRWAPAGVNRWLRDLGIFGQRSHEKRIPAAVFRLSNAQIAQLLRHLWATDGSIGVRRENSHGGHRGYF